MPDVYQIASSNYMYSSLIFIVPKKTAPTRKILKITKDLRMKMVKSSRKADSPGHGDILMPRLPHNLLLLRVSDLPSLYIMFLTFNMIFPSIGNFTLNYLNCTCIKF